MNYPISCVSVFFFCHGIDRGIEYCVFFILVMCQSLKFPVITYIYQCEQFSPCVHLLIWATRATAGWMHWSGLMRTAIYETIDSCPWVFHSIWAEIPNVNNNNLQVFEGYVITFSLWEGCWKTRSLRNVRLWFGCHAMKTDCRTCNDRFS